SNRLREALDQIESAEKALGEITSPATRDGRRVSLNLTSARIWIASGDLHRSEELLRSNSEFLSRNATTGRLNHIRSQSLLLLSKVLMARGRAKEAGEQLREAVSLAESDQDYLTNLNLQVAFDVERRQLYEAAIAFEFQQGCEEPWKLLQSYKAKLFLQLL